MGTLTAGCYVLIFVVPRIAAHVAVTHKTLQWPRGMAVSASVTITITVDPGDGSLVIEA
jgi:hypothetical protein